MATEREEQLTKLIEKKFGQTITPETARSLASSSRSVEAIITLIEMNAHGVKSYGALMTALNTVSPSRS